VLLKPLSFVFDLFDKKSAEERAKDVLEIQATAKKRMDKFLKGFEKIVARQPTWLEKEQGVKAPF